MSSTYKMPRFTNKGLKVTPMFGSLPMLQNLFNRESISGVK